ncbi:hypothetical protein Pmar_PMAR008367, partial [Perkinsus marinus ATCC 50983]
LHNLCIRRGRESFNAIDYIDPEIRRAIRDENDMNEPLGGDGLVEGGLQGVEQLLLWEDPNLAASFLALMRNGDNNNDVDNDN